MVIPHHMDRITGLVMTEIIGLPQVADGSETVGSIQQGDVSAHPRHDTALLE